MKGIVLKSTGKFYKVKLENESVIEAQLKGKIRLLDLDVTNPVAVGDVVLLEKSDKTWMISKIEDRKNYIIRISPKKKFLNQIIASNIDQAVLVITLSKPRTSTGFIDRFLLTAESYHINTIIVFNKQDDLSNKDQTKQNELADLYQGIGYEVLFTSAIKKQGVEELKQKMKEKTTLLSGHSGVGKSTLTNAVDSTLNLKTKEVSKKFSKGVHTTTHAEMFSLPFGGNVIDVPGIKEFGIAHLDKYEVADYFIEFQAKAANCKFSDCLHINEPKCKVKEAVDEGEIHVERYLNYLNILDSLEEQKEY